jgi:hypothetical protein
MAYYYYLQGKGERAGVGPLSPKKRNSLLNAVFILALFSDLESDGLNSRYQGQRLDIVP